MVVYEDRWLVREFVPEDYGQVAFVWKETKLSRPERADNLETIMRTIDHGGIFYVLEDLDTKKIIGTSWITNDGRRLHLQYFGILPEYQGRKLSHYLLEHSLDFARQTGLQIKLEVHKTNIIAKNLYEKWGFKKLDGYEIYILRDL